MKITMLRDRPALGEKTYLFECVLDEKEIDTFEDELRRFEVGTPSLWASGWNTHHEVRGGKLTHWGYVVHFERR